MASFGFQNHLGSFVAPSRRLLPHQGLGFQFQQGCYYPPHHFNHRIRIRSLAAAANTATTSDPQQQTPTSSTSPPSPSIRDKGWVSFAEKVSGEWDGHGADFSKSGEPIELPESVVPEAFREWDVKVFDWQTQCPTLARPQPDFYYRLITLLPTVGCEADAATTYATLERNIASSLAFGYQSTTGSYVGVWPVQGDGQQVVIELEHCLVDPGDAHSRVRVIQVVRVLGEGMMELDAIKVFCEQWYGPFRNGDQLGGCSIRDSAFASTPALEPSKISGVWQETRRAFATFQDPSNNHIKQLEDDDLTAGPPQSFSRDGGDGVILLPKQLWCCSPSNQNEKENSSLDFQVGWLLEDGLAIISNCSFSRHANLKEISVTHQQLRT